MVPIVLLPLCTANCNMKEAMALIQMELKGETLQLCWKPAQKKNSQNQIVIYGLVPRFNPKGVMRELVYGLKESKKELCDAKKFSLTENVDQQDRALPLFNGYFKQATAPKASSQSESKDHKARCTALGQQTRVWISCLLTLSEMLPIGLFKIVRLPHKR